MASLRIASLLAEVESLKAENAALKGRQTQAHVAKFHNDG
jgi:hypothetical protein